MRLSLKPFLIIFAFLLSMPASSQRSGRTKDPTLNPGQGLEVSREELSSIRNNNQDKNARQVDLYMFGICYSVLDSTLFISDVRLVQNAVVNNKWFLKNRNEYENQFREFVSGTYDDSMIPVIYFSDNKKRVVRQRETLLKRNKKKVGFEKIEVRGFDFKVPVSQ